MNQAGDTPKKTKALDSTPSQLTHKARKRFGQNFLVDGNIIRNIVRAIMPKAEDILVEIGPGQGAITGPLLETCPSLQVIEIDRDLIPRLKVQFFNYPEFTIHESDALKFDFLQLVKDNKKLRVVGNLPYNISTPLLFRLLDYREHIQDMHFMLQKEVVTRLAASPGDKNYGRLGIMVQYYCKVISLVEVPPTAFLPQPKVDSAVVRIEPYSEPPFVADNFKLLENVVNRAFQQRRKTLRNTLKHFISDEQMQSLSVDCRARPETLSVAEFVNLSNQLNQLLKS